VNGGLGGRDLGGVFLQKRGVRVVWVTIVSRVQTAGSRVSGNGKGVLGEGRKSFQGGGWFSVSGLVLTGGKI